MMVEIPVTQEKLAVPNYAPGETRLEMWHIAKVIATGETYQLPICQIPQGMQRVEIENDYGRVRLDMKMPLWNY